MIEREPVPIDDPDPVIPPKDVPPMDRPVLEPELPMELPEDPDSPKQMDL